MLQGYKPEQGRTWTLFPALWWQTLHLAPSSCRTSASSFPSHISFRRRHEFPLCKQQLSLDPSGRQKTFLSMGVAPAGDILPSRGAQLWHRLRRRWYPHYYHYYWSFLYTYQTHCAHVACDSAGVTVSFYNTLSNSRLKITLLSHQRNNHRTGGTDSTTWLLHGWCQVKLLPSRRVFCVHHTTMHQFMVSLHSKPHK